MFEIMTFHSPSALMIGCLGQWTVWSFYLTNKWWRSVGVWLLALTNCLGVRSCSTTPWLSIMDKHNSRLSSATTFSTSTRASRSFSVRGNFWFPIAQEMLFSSSVLSYLFVVWFVISEWEARESAGGSAAEPEAAGHSLQGGAPQTSEIHGHRCVITGGQTAQRGVCLCTCIAIFVRTHLSSKPQ